MELALKLAVPLLAGLIGVAVGYGALRNQVKNNRGEIGALKTALGIVMGNPTGEPVYIKRSECQERTGIIHEEIIEVKQQLSNQCRSTKSLQNWARWMLAKKEGLNPIEIAKILNGD